MDAVQVRLPRRQRKIRDLLRAWLDCQPDSVVACHVRGALPGFAPPRTKVVNGEEIILRDPYDSGKADALGRVRPAPIEPKPLELDAAPLTPTEAAAQVYSKRRAALGDTIPYLELALARMRSERPDLFRQIRSTSDDAIAWLADALDGVPIQCPAWARS